MIIRKAELADQDIVLELLDQFRTDCIEQITGVPTESHSARDGGREIFETLLDRSDYCILLLVSPNSEAVGIITGYLCPMLRNGKVRSEVEEFFVKKEYRGHGNATILMDAFFAWSEENDAQKVNLESENELDRAHSFYKKYGFETKAQRFIKKINS